MSTYVDTAGAVTAPDLSSVKRSSRGRWIDRWEPEDEVFWEQTGRAIARRTGQAGRPAPRSGSSRG
jgi:NNP family nitrate/nitrite transporter-like MFS transporter